MATTSHRRRLVLVTLDPAAGTPLYQQIHQALRDAILDGRLPAGAPLPSTRALATELAVARTTVVQAYEQLRAEGYVTGRAGAATRVSATLPDHRLRAAAPPEPARCAPHAGRPSRRAAVAAASTGPMVGLIHHRPPGAFRGASAAVDAFPLELWGRLLARRWRRSTVRMLGYGDPFGHPPLRAAIAEYLQAARGVRCRPEQVLVTCGAQQALDYVARATLDAGDTVWVEDPGYPLARGAFELAGARVVPVPVDDEGLDAALGRRLAPAARLAYVTPSRQFPLGTTMSERRRRRLLAWAAETGAWIVEDDYAAEFRYAARPAAALQAADAAGCVVHVGTFSKVVFPALRLGYAVIPDALLDAVATVSRCGAVHVPMLEQAVMADFIVEGHFERHVRRLRALYAERAALLVALAREQLDGLLDVQPTDGGLHALGWLPPALDDRRVQQAAQRHGVDVLPLSSFAFARPMPPGLLLGFGGVDEGAIREGIARLGAALRETGTGIRQPPFPSHPLP